MAGEETVWKGIIELDVLDNGVAGKVNAIADQLQAQMQRLNSFPGVNLGGALTEGLVASLSSASGALGRFEGQLTALRAAQQELAGGGSGFQNAYVDSLIGSYERLIGKVLEYQMLAARPMGAPAWAVDTAARSQAYAIEAGVPVSRVAQAQIAMQQAVVQSQFTPPAITAAPSAQVIQGQILSSSYPTPMDVNDRLIEAYRGTGTNPVANQPFDQSVRGQQFASGLAQAEAREAEILSATAAASEVLPTQAQRLAAASARYAASLERAAAEVQAAAAVKPVGGPLDNYSALSNRLRDAAHGEALLDPRQQVSGQLGAIGGYGYAPGAGAADVPVGTQGALSAKIIAAQEQIATAAEQTAVEQKAIAEVKAQELIAARRGLLYGSSADFNQTNSPRQLAEQQVQVADAANKAAIEKLRLAVDPSATVREQIAGGQAGIPIQNASAAQQAELNNLIKQRVLTEKELLAAEKRVQAAVNEEAIAAGGLGGGGSAGGRGGGGFFGGLSGSSGGRFGGADFAEQAGTLVKYMAMYKAFELGVKLIKDVKTQTEEYSLAVNQLSIALGGNEAKAQGMAQSYSQIGQSLGTVPTIAVDAATKYTRFFQDTSGVSGNVGAQLGSTVNILEGAKASGTFGDPAQRALANDKTLGELAAIAKNYDMGAQGASGLYDAAVVIAQHYGQQQGGSLLGGTAQIADLLKESGFTAQQGLALVGSVQQFTGNTSEMAAGDLKRFLGRSGSTTFQDVFTQYGIDQNQSLRDELVQLGGKFKTLDEHQRNAAITTLGGGRAGAAVVAAITDLPDQTQIATKGANSIGAATEQATARLATFAGKLEQIDASFQALAKDIGTSGLGGLFGQGLQLIDPLLRGVDQLVQDFSKLPGFAKEALDILLLASVAGRAFGGGFGITGVAGMLNKIGGVAEVAPETGAKGAATAATERYTVALAANAEATAVATKATVDAAVAAGADAAAIDVETAALETNAGAAAGGALTLSARFALLGSAALAAAGPLAAIAAIIAGFVILGKAHGAADEATIGLNGILDANTQRDAAKTPQDLQAAADAFGRNADILQKEKDSFGGKVAIAGSNYADSLNPLNDAFLLKHPFGGVDKTQGLGGAEDHTIAYARQQQAEINARIAPELAFQDRQAYVGSLMQAGVHGDAATVYRQQNPAGAAFGFTAPDAFAAEFNYQSAARDKQPLAAETFGPSFSNIPNGIANLKRTHASVDTSIAVLTSELANIPTTDIASFLAPASGKGAGDELKRLTTQVGQNTNPLGRESDLRKIAGMARDLAAAPQDGISQEATNGYLDAANKAASAAILSNVKLKIDSIHALQSDNAHSQAQIKAIVQGGAFALAETGSIEALISLMAGMNAAEINQLKQIEAEKIGVLQKAREGLLQMMEVANAALIAAAAPTGSEKGRGYKASTPDEIAASLGDTAVADNAKKIAAEKAGLAAINTAAGLAAPTGSNSAAKSFHDYVAPKQGPTPPTADQIEEARLAAQAIPGDPMSAAITNLRVAQYKMNEPKNAVEYWTALKALHDAQYAYSQANLVAVNDAALLGIDITDPLAMAREKVQEATRVLALDRSTGHLPDVINKDELALKQARSSAEKTAFSQQFSDQQTNYNLQRESLSAYLSYLHSQHDYLTHVRNKTRDQVDELNQVDQALKSLGDSMQGQFNLGQIKLPTPYEVRRIAAGGGGSTSNVQITINGADIAQIKSVLAQYVGTAVMATAGTSVRKV